jgi:hypothetical protein
VTLLVDRVFLTCAPAEIAEMIMSSSSVDVTYLVHPGRARADEGEQHEHVDGDGALRPVDVT